jgi:UDP-N-acetylglucosamine 2-epimerase (non-hydrolysing)
VILTIYGTTGELIKLAPVLERLRAGGHRYLSATTGQQVSQIPVFLDAFGLPQPDLWLGRGSGGRDLRASRDIPGWAAGVAARFARNRGRLRRELRAGPGRPLVLVHGDTMTTVLGALMGRALGAPVAHVEAGLRSFDLRHPFPEELNRRLTSAIASIHYAPGSWAASNLRRGRVVDTGSNTIRDSLELAGTAQPPALGLPEPPFGIVSLHRFELLNDRTLLAETLALLARHSERIPLVFVDHPVTAAAIERFRLEPVLAAGRFVRIPRLTFHDFVAVMRRSSFLFTDSGGSQEECYYLDLPCLVHRRTTERREGLGENVVLSGYDPEAVRGFLAAPERFRRAGPLAAASPSDVILADLGAAGFL